MRLTFIALLLLLPWTLSAHQDSPLSNQLKNNASPYLALHGQDPVAWQEWGEAVLSRARAENKLLFVSVGYFACHWCHVMQRESFSDANVAVLLNEHFISVKVDRELYPALDARLIEFVRRSRGNAGWPLNVIVTPEGYPLLGMTYLPKAQLLSLLQKVQQRWREQPAYWQQTAAAAAQADAQQDLVKANPRPKNQQAWQQVFSNAQTLYAQQAMNQADTLLGGFGQQAKFPRVAQLNALMSVYQSGRQADIAEFVILTLEQMATQGMRDAIGGGFFRYTVDPDWQTPHFEKMLYDNAALATLYLRAGKVFQRKDFDAIGYETLDFMAANMQTAQGGMISSFSAVDKHNVEGGYYLWQQQDLKTLLDKKQFATLLLLWAVDKPAPFSAGYLPKIARPYEAVAEQLRQPLQQVIEQSLSAYRVLGKARRQRGLPKDDKQLASWNGLALSAYATALQNQGLSERRRQRYDRVANKIHDYLTGHLIRKGVLLRSVDQSGSAMGQAGLEDYAFVARGMADWYQARQRKQDKQLALRLIDQAWRQFYSERGWQQSNNTLLPYSIGVAAIEDNSLPSPSATLIQLSHELRAQPRLKLSEALAISEKLLLTEVYLYPGQLLALQAFVESP